VTGTSPRQETMPHSPSSREPSSRENAVTLHIWRIPTARLPRVLWRVALDRGRLRRTPGVRFAKLLGTGTLGPTRADPTRWAAIIAWEGQDEFSTTKVAGLWRSLATSYCRIDLETMSSRGTWAGRQPFTPARERPTRERTEGPVLAITRARLRPGRAITFWRAMDAVTAAARHAPGLLAAFGIGEAPVGWQGTVSLWRTLHDLVQFAYRHPKHRRAIEQTESRKWYGEELFAHFAVLDVTGDRDIIGWTQDRTEDQAVDPIAEGKAPVRIVPWTPRDLTRRLDDVIVVYGQAMGYSADLLATRRGYMASHVHRRGFRAVASLDTQGRLLGFGYGYISESGQWWHDQVRGAMRRDQRARWLSNCFEVVELHVHPLAQGHGLGAAQLRSLLRMTTAKTTLLSTPEADEATSRAWRLYRRFGFVDIVRKFTFPGDARPFAVLGRTLPLTE
jgi:ribosomal protein S18 acetylase RimI-like enzyme